jgi:hypothetical protein
MRKYLFIYEDAVGGHIRYDFATAPFWISLYMRIFFSFFQFTVTAYIKILKINPTSRCSSFFCNVCDFVWRTIHNPINLAKKMREKFWLT